MPEYNNNDYSETYDGRPYGPGGKFDGGTGRRCRVIGCPRMIYQDELCAVHWSWKETIKPAMGFSPSPSGCTSDRAPEYVEIL